MDSETKHSAIIIDSGVNLVKDVFENSRSSRETALDNNMLEQIPREVNIIVLALLSGCLSARYGRPRFAKLTD